MRARLATTLARAQICRAFAAALRPQRAAQFGRTLPGRPAMAAALRLWPATRLAAPLGALAVALLGGCASVGQVYRAPGYDPQHAADAVKRVAVVGWAPADRPGLAAVVAAEARDLLKLRKNYLVYSDGPAVRDWTEGCGEHREGVVLIRALAADPAPPAASERAVALSLATELYRCADGALLWRACASGAGTSQDESLAQLTANYAETLGAPARTYAAPAFVLLQGLMAALPDPALADADVEEKLELD